MNIGQMLTNVRLRCGTPRPQSPPPRTLLLLLSTQIQNFLTEANLSGRAWAMDEVNLVVSTGQEDYVLPVDSSFGKPVQVRTVNNSDPGHVERDVPFFDLGDLNFDWPFAKNIGVGYTDSSMANASRLAFFRRAGQDQIHVRAIPIPQASATYQILYQIGVYGETQAMEETPLLPEHHALIEVRTAFGVLPHCEWGDNEDLNTTRRAQIALSLEPDSRRLERNFKTYIATMTGHRGMSVRHAPIPID